MHNSKCRLASYEWLDLAREQLIEVVESSGDSKLRFSMCEVYLNAPAGLIGHSAGRAAWHFRINAGKVFADEGEVDDVDVKYLIDYQEAEGLAKAVIDDESRVAPPRSLVVEGDASMMPQLLKEVHNRLVPSTL